MKELAKECLEIHEKIKQLLPVRQDKGGKLAEYIKSQLLSNLGEDYEDIDVWCNSCDDDFSIHINIPVNDYTNEYVLICALDNKKFALHDDTDCSFKEILNFAKKMVVKLNREI